MTQPPKQIPEWTDVLDAFEQIPGDPDLLGSVKDILLRFLVHIRRSSTHDDTVYMKCLKKYGIVTGVTIGAEEDWPESIALLRALDLLVEQMGDNVEVQNFLYNLKGCFWFINEKSGLIDVIFDRGKKMYRYLTIWYKLIQRESVVLGSKKLTPHDGFYSCSLPPELPPLLQKIPESPKYKKCHPSISSGALNLFVLYALSSKRALSKDDFWGIIAHERMDFLEYLLIDLPEKKLPYSLMDMVMIALFMMHNGERAVKMLQLIEQASPGMISGFSDSRGGNLLWYSIFASSGKPPVNEDGVIVLPPVQEFLYRLCDHEKPNCDGISFDELCRYYPAKYFQ